jgi:uncharacterized membrane protein YraQ (UPF0718 family)
LFEILNLSEDIMGWHELGHAFLHAMKDTLIILPFLLVILILIAALEARVDFKKHARLLGGRLAPLVGSVTGVIPQCGFSVMSVKLYQERCITVGTLLAIFVSTSDEAVTLLLSQGLWKDFLLLVAVKLVIGCVVGYLADFVLRSRQALRWNEEEGETCTCCKHGSKTDSLHVYLLHPLLHCLETALYVFVVNFVLGVVVEFVGEESIASFMAGTEFLQPVVASLVGLIPNCASSVLLVEVYAAGNLTFGALVAGLTANAGVGLALLFKQRKTLKRNLLITLVLYVAGVVFGELITVISVLLT